MERGGVPVNKKIYSKGQRVNTTTIQGYYVTFEMVEGGVDLLHDVGDVDYVDLVHYIQPDADNTY